MHLEQCVCLADVAGTPVEDGAVATVAAFAAEAGPLLAVQCGGPHSSHVGVRPACPLARLRLVRHRSQRAGQQ